MLVCFRYTLCFLLSLFPESLTHSAGIQGIPLTVPGSPWWLPCKHVSTCCPLPSPSHSRQVLLLATGVAFRGGSLSFPGISSTACQGGHWSNCTASSPFPLLLVRSHLLPGKFGRILISALPCGWLREVSPGLILISFCSCRRNEHLLPMWPII